MNISEEIVKKLFSSTRNWVKTGSCYEESVLDPFDEQESEMFIKQNCMQCPVIEKCKQYAQDNDIKNGVWGGEFLK